MYKNLNMGALGHNVPFDEVVKLAQRHHFAGVDLDLTYLAALNQSQGLQQAKAWFAATGLRASAFGLQVAWREWDSEAAYADSLQKLAHDAALSQAFGCTRCFTWVMPRSDQLNFYQHFNLVFPRLKRIAEILGEYGIRLGLEFVGPNTMREGRAYDFVHTMDGMRTLAAAIGATSRNTGLLLDAFHWWTSHGTVTELRHLNAAEVVYVHLNDAQAGLARDAQIDQIREQVGATGVIPIQPFLAALRHIGYDGPLTVEPFSTAIKVMSSDAAAAATSAALDQVLAAA